MKKNYLDVCPKCGAAPIICKKGRKVKAGRYIIRRCATCGYYMQR